MNFVIKSGFLIIFLLCISVVNNGISAQANDSISIYISNGIPDNKSLDNVNRLITEAIKLNTFEDTLISDALTVSELARKLDYPTGLADALLNLVRGYVSRYESTKSLAYALEAFNIYEKYNNHDKMAYTLLQLGIIYYTQNNYLKSLEYYNNSVSEYEKIGNKSYIATLFYLSGINYSKLNNHASALSFFNRAKEIKTGINDEKGIAECNIGLADLYLSMNKPDSTIYFLKLAQTYTSKANNKYGSAKAGILMAEAYYNKMEYDSAIQMANIGLIDAAEVKARELMVDAHKILYRINAAKKEYEQAYIDVINFISLRDSIINEKTSRNFSKLEGEYILEKKQNEILLLEKDNRNKALIMWASIIIGILALLLSLLYYNKNQIKQKANRKLEQAYHDLETTQQQLVQQEKLASLGQLTAGIAHEIKNPLNFVNNFSHLSVDLIKELNEAVDSKEKDAILNDLQLNIQKIAHHGERANSIVTRMLEHSRTGKREIEPTDINKLVKEYAQLSYQAIRIKHPGFASKINIHLDEKVPVLHVVSQEISRVLLNILNNCLYVVAEKHDADKSFHPELTISSHLNNNLVTIEIKDNGPGIPENIREQIFQPFFTTKPAGEGTGLGLSISYDIIKAHGGNIVAKNNTEAGASFVITLPVK
ncbi:MAG: ATP-binding protein [Bacteroidota bacterium]|nr:ATP-binding protein [Bacteroidota bacterium]